MPLASSKRHRIATTEARDARFHVQRFPSTTRCGARWLGVSHHEVAHCIVEEESPGGVARNLHGPTKIAMHALPPGLFPNDLAHDIRIESRGDAGKPRKIAVFESGPNEPVEGDQHTGRCRVLNFDHNAQLLLAVERRVGDTVARLQ